VQFYRKTSTKTKRLGVLAGGFNPPTVAHVAIVAAAQPHLDQVLCVVPRTFPHKRYFGATLEQRLEMLGSLKLAVPHSVAATDQGLFIDIARECREEFGDDTRLLFLCGRDAADRILSWDYGRAGVVEEMLGQFELLVAERGGEFECPPGFEARAHLLKLAGEHNEVSSTEVRERISRGEAWESLVPEEIVNRVREIYS